MRWCGLAAAALAWAVVDLAPAQDKTEGEKKTDAPAAVTEEAKVLVRLETTLGNIVLELDREKAPITVANFLRYVNEKYYDGLIFHRVVPTFMIQGGGFDKDYNLKSAGLHEPIKLESKNGLKNVKGTIAMARTNFPDSATSQFFINVVDNAMLDYPKPDGNGYTVFGKVSEGAEVVEKIRTAKCTRHPKYQGSPQDGNPDPAVIITKARQIGADGKEMEAKQAEATKPADQDKAPPPAAKPDEKGKEVPPPAPEKK